MRHRLLALVRRPGSLVTLVGLTAAVGVALAGSSHAAAAVAFATIAAAQIVHQDQIVRLMGRLAHDQRHTLSALQQLERDGASTRTAAERLVDDIRAVDQRMAVVPAEVERVTGDRVAGVERRLIGELKGLDGQLDSHVAELRERMAQAYRHRERLTNQVQSLLSLQGRIAGGPGLPPLRGWALMPDNADAVFTLAREFEAVQIVELGSGTSTALLALEAKQRGRGHVTAIEHEPEYAEQTRRLVARFDASDHTTVLEVPLKPVEIEPWSIPWYDLSQLALPDAIDLLLVDGPPGATHEFARLPAELLFDRLTPGAVVVLDDTERPEERQIVDRWLSRGDFTLIATPKTEKGLTVLQRSPRA